MVVPAAAVGQTIFSRPYEPNQITVEAIVPELPDRNSSFPSGATFLTATRSLTERVELTAELPVARYINNGTSATAVGNPYVGVGLSGTRTPFLVELGVRIPAVPTNRAPAVGRRADPGRTAAFRDEAYSLSSLLNGRLALGRYTTLRLRAGLTYASVETASDSSRTRHWSLPYSAQLWHEGTRLLTGLSVIGRPALSSAPSLESYTHRALASVLLDHDRVQPGLFVGTGLSPLITDGQVVLIGGLTLSISYDR
jgi:hypothetical protein